MNISQGNPPVLDKARWGLLIRWHFIRNLRRAVELLSRRGHRKRHGLGRVSVYSRGRKGDTASDAEKTYHIMEWLVLGELQRLSWRPRRESEIYGKSDFSSILRLTWMPCGWDNLYGAKRKAETCQGYMSVLETLGKSMVECAYRI